AALHVQTWLARAGILTGPVQWASSTGQQLGVHNHYEPVSQLGADRWLAMLGLASHERQRRDFSSRRAILATFGTATTIDTLMPRARQGRDALEASGSQAAIEAAPQRT